MAFRTGYRIHGRWPLGVAFAVVLIGITGVLSNAAGPWPYAVGGGAVMDPLNPLVSSDPNALLNEDHFAFSALQGPSSCRGDFGSLGHGRFDLPDGDVLGPVSCVSVSGNQAVFVVQNDKGSNTITSLRVYVQDNGDLGLPDQITWEPVALPPSPAGLQCTVPFTASALKTVVKGNIQVRFEPGGCPPSMQR
jgi:hypothetical protein